MKARRMEEGNPNQQYVLPVRNFLTDEEQLKAVVLRYLTLEKFISLLELEAMWFSRLGALQDKFEGTVPKGARARLLELEKDRERSEKMFGSKLLAHLLNVMNTGTDDSARIGVAVNCWFLGQDESEKMWHEYGQEGKGVAIRSTVKRLSTSLHITGDYVKISAVGRVQYVDFESHEMTAYDANNVNRVAFIKEKKDFESEQEVRIITMNCLHSGCLAPDGNPVSDYQLTGPALFDPNRKGFYVKCRLQELIQAVIVGPNAQPHFITLIKRLVNRYRLFVEVEPSRLSPKQ